MVTIQISAFYLISQIKQGYQIFYFSVSQLYRPDHDCIRPDTVYTLLVERRISQPNQWTTNW